MRGHKQKWGFPTHSGDGGGGFRCATDMCDGALPSSSAGNDRLASSGKMAPAVRADKLSLVPCFVFVEGSHLDDSRLRCNALPTLVVRSGS